MLRRRLLLMMQQAQVVWRTVVKTGTGLIVANDTTDGQPVDLQLQGWTEQDSTNGLQLWDNKKAKTVSEWLGSDVYKYITLPLKPNTTYTFSMKENNMNNSYEIGFTCSFYVGENFGTAGNQLIGNSGVASSVVKKTYTFTTSDNPFYFNLFIAGGLTEDRLNVIFENLFVNIMLNEGSTALPYEPYTGGQPSPSPEYQQDIVNAGKYNEETGKYEIVVTISDKEQEPTKQQTVTVTSDRPITKWDRLVEKDGQIGWEYGGIVLQDFNGNNKPIYTGNKVGNVQHFRIVFSDAKDDIMEKLYCDKFYPVITSYTKEQYAVCSNWNGGTKYFSSPNENVTTLEEFKQWLTENPISVAYQLKTPEFFPLSTEEQELLKSLKTYYPTTVFSNNQEMFMQVEYQTKRNFVLKKPEKATSMFDFGVKWNECNKIVLKGSGVKSTTQSMIFTAGKSTSPYITMNGNIISFNGLTDTSYTGYSSEIVDGRFFEIEFRFSSSTSGSICNIWDSAWSKEIVYHEIIFYNGDTLLADFVPDMGNSDRMYNKVNGQYITASELGVYELMEV